MKSNIKISVPNPCAENWDEMKPNNCGRFCASCEKTVIDFTKMHDEKFIAYFQNSKKLFCGRFTERQLSLNIPFKSKPLLPFWKLSKYVATSMITVAGLGVRVFAQKVETIVTQNDSTKTSTDSQIQKNNEFIELSGFVIDNYNEAVPGALVEILNFSIGTNTDVDGRFQIMAPKTSVVNNFVYLKINGLGLKEKIQTFNISSGITSIRVSLEQGNMMVGDVIITKPTYWQRFKNWLKNNFL